MNVQHRRGLVFPVSADGNRIGCWNKALREAGRKLAFLNRIDDLTDAAQLSLDPPLSCCMQKSVAIPGLEHSKHKLLVTAFHCAVTSSQDWLPCEAIAITFSDPEVSVVVIWTRVAEPNVGHVTTDVAYQQRLSTQLTKRQNWSQRSMPYAFTCQRIWIFCLCENVWGCLYVYLYDFISNFFIWKWCTIKSTAVEYQLHRDWNWEIFRFQCHRETLEYPKLSLIWMCLQKIVNTCAWSTT